MEGLLPGEPYSEMSILGMHTQQLTLQQTGRGCVSFILIIFVVGKEEIMAMDIWLHLRTGVSWTQICKQKPSSLDP